VSGGDRSTQYWDDVERVFSAVLDLPQHAAGERLDELCVGRADLRAEVESLLAAHVRGAGTFLDDRVHGSEADGSSTPGATIGAFRLLERIGAGGMGTVYRAERADGEFAQQVAVKLIAASVGHPSAARRFRAERQILARLHHPHIVALLDGGITPQGQAYLVMEYVEGVRISQYCREHALTLRERIELVRRVCAAVQYSHQHFVVHRDLKPANILVTADGVPKVLDFGVATLLEGSPVPGATVSRAADLAAMTPNYASPEQIRGVRATVASDVYALGVLLYELLTGARPYETAGKPFDEVMRLVVEIDPPRPSTAVPRDEQRPSYDLRALRGDVDAIVQQALRKAPEERYQSAAALSDDLQRFLSGRPVEAREPSFAYVVQKLAAQHRTAFITLAVSLIVIVALLGVSVAQTRIARAERDRARAEATKARQMSAFLGGVFRNANPARSGGRTPTARDLLDRGTASIAAELDGQPDVQASLLLVMADAYGDLSDQPAARMKALELAERSLALLDDRSKPPTIDLANSVYSVGRKYLRVGRPAEALPFLERALKLRESLLGPQSLPVAEVLGSLALAHNALGHVDETGALFERAIAIQDAASPGGDAAASLRNNYGVFLLGRRQFDRAEAMFRRSIAEYEKVPGDEQIALPLVNLGELLSRREDLEPAEALFERAMAISARIYGAESFPIAYDLAYLGDLARRKGDLPRARTLLEESLRLYAKTMPPDHYEVVAPASYLGETFLDLHQPEQALPYLERALRISEQSKGPDHPTADILVDIANAREQMNQLSEAQAAAERALDLQRASLPPDHISFVPTLTALGRIVARRGRPAEARPILEEAVRIARAGLPPSHSARLRAEAALALAANAAK